MKFLPALGSALLTSACVVLSLMAIYHATFVPLSVMLAGFLPPH